VTRRQRNLRIGIVVFLAAIIAFLALRSSPFLQYIPWMPRRLGVWADHHGVSRNAVAFFGLGLAVFLLVGIRGWHFALVCGFAAGLEVAQLWIPSRRFDWRDIAVSIVGIALAWPIAWALRRWRTSRC
jgi:hypothetical protein